MNVENSDVVAREVLGEILNRIQDVGERGAQKILDDRYAKGEITRKEYLQAKEDLKNFNPK